MSDDKRSGGYDRKPPRGGKKPFGPKKPFSGKGRSRPGVDGDAPPRRTFRDRDDAREDRPSRFSTSFRDDTSPEQGYRRQSFEPRFDPRREKDANKKPSHRKSARHDDKSVTRNPESSHADGERIAKVIARAGLGSRRDAEAWIEEGRVSINGETLTSAARNVLAGDKVMVDGKPLPSRERTRLWLYHKPRGLVTTEKDPEGRPTVFENLPSTLPRVMSVGRLDINTEGLLLLTNDGGLARQLELPKTGWMRRYRVRAFGETDQVQLDKLFDGLTIDGVDYGRIEARLDKEQGANSWLTLGLREGKNREVKNVLGSIGLDVNRLIRVSYGPFQLGDIPEGGIEEVKTRILVEQLGADLIAEAGCEFEAPAYEHGDDIPEIQTKRTGKGENRRGLRVDGEDGNADRIMRGSLIADRHGKRVLVQRIADIPKDKPHGRKPFRNRDEGGERPFKPRPSFRDRDEGGERPFKPRPSFRDRNEGGERPFKPRPSFRDRDEGGERPFKPRPSFRDRNEGGERPFKPRSSFRDRNEGGERPFKPRPSFRDRDEGGERPFKPRSSFRDRNEGGERPFKPRPSFRDRDEGGERPFKPRSSFRDRNEGGERPFKPRPSFRDRNEGGERPFKARPSFRERSENGDRPFKPRRFEDRGGGGERSFKPRDSKPYGGRGSSGGGRPPGRGGPRRGT